jgi:hypothetical protein
MKKMLLIVSAALLVNPICATIDWKNIQDMSILASAVTISAVGATIANSYWHQASLEREKFAAVQADKRAKEQKEREDRQKSEHVEQMQAQATSALHKIIHNYKQELDALLHQGLSKNSKLFESIVKGKQSIPVTRYLDYGKTAAADFETLIKLSPDLSLEQKKIQETFIKDFHNIISIFNTFFSEVAYAEKVELKKNDLKDKMAQFAIEKVELENKTLRAKADAYKAESENTQLLKRIIHEIHIIRQDCSRIDTHAVNMRAHLNNLCDNLKVMIANGSTQIKQQLSSLFMQKRLCKTLCKISTLPA